MSAAGHKFESSPGNDYFQAIEELFLGLRGAPLTLVPDDWHLSQQWYELGMPLEWVGRTIREIIERRRAKGTLDRVTGLRSIRTSLEAAWKRERQLTAPARSGEVEALDVGARLEGLAAASPPDLGARIRALEGDAEQIEARLAALDRECLDRAWEELDAAGRKRLEEALAEATSTLARRLPREELTAAADELRDRLLRDQLGLPVLSLFAPQAVAGEKKRDPVRD